MNEKNDKTYQISSCREAKEKFGTVALDYEYTMTYFNVTPVTFTSSKNESMVIEKERY